MSITPEHSKLTKWLWEASQRDASDLHLVAERRPSARINGTLVELGEPIQGTELESLLLDLCTDEQHQILQTTRNLDFAPAIVGTDNGAELVQRFRANYFFAEKQLGACFRVIQSVIPTLQWANFPFELADTLSHFKNGLVLVTGVTGSGKSTTLAMIINLLVQEGGYRIITIEEPIEYKLDNRRDSVITQREVGEDVSTFADGLRSGLRQDPDVIMVGEIRDQQTAQIVLSAAETGHLVFSTMHTRDAKGAVTRFADFFPQSVQSDIRSQLALSLRAVVAQHLLPSTQPMQKRELALEVMFNNNPIAAAIRQGKHESIDNNILTGKSIGMVPMDDSLMNLYRGGKISRETAEHHLSDPKKLG